MTDHNFQQPQGVLQPGHGSSIHSHGTLFVPQNQPQNVHNCYELTSALLLSFLKTYC